jgi:hypothetical protein
MKKIVLIGALALMAGFAMKSFCGKNETKVQASGVEQGSVATPKAPLRQRTEVKSESVSEDGSAPDKKAQEGSDKRLERITTLSRIVLPTARKIEALRPLLNDPRLAVEIDSALSDSRSYDGQGFKKKLRLLDAMYTAMKFPDAGIRSRYLNLAAKILNEPAPRYFSEGWKRHFRADRAEVAMVLLKIKPDQVDGIARTRQAALALSEAKRLQSSYEVGL